MAQTIEKIQFHNTEDTEESILKELSDENFDESMSYFDPDFPEWSKGFKITITVEEVKEEIKDACITK